MIKGGYILQPRSIDESEASKMPPVTRELWLYLLRKVNYSDGAQFKRGQNFFNLTDIQNDLCWYAGYRKMVYSKPQLTKSLRRLIESNMIATAKATRGVVVTVCNYNEYQDPSNYEGNDERSTKEPRKKREGHTINKKVEEGKKEEKESGHKEVIERLKKIHLNTCGLTSRPPLSSYDRWLSAGKTEEFIVTTYERIGGYSIGARQRLLIDFIDNPKDGECEVDPAKDEELFRSIAQSCIESNLPPAHGSHKRIFEIYKELKNA